MNQPRKIAGTLMIASGFTHTSELFVFEWGPVLGVVLGFGVAFFIIGIFLLRPGDKVLWWGAALPALAAFLGIANSIRNGYIHPYTVWHLAVDLTVFPICTYLLVKLRASARAA